MRFSLYIYGNHFKQHNVLQYTKLFYRPNRVKRLKTLIMKGKEVSFLLGESIGAVLLMRIGGKWSVPYYIDDLPPSVIVRMVAWKMLRRRWFWIWAMFARIIAHVHPSLSPILTQNVTDVKKCVRKYVFWSLRMLCDNLSWRSLRWAKADCAYDRRKRVQVASIFWWHQQSMIHQSDVKEAFQECIAWICVEQGIFPGGPLSVS